MTNPNTVLGLLQISQGQVPRKVFIDTSVWIYTHGPQANPNDQRSANYSTILANLIMAGAEIYITPVVLSEFFNVTIGYFKRQDAPSSKLKNKAYRNSQHYKVNLPFMYSYMTSILSTPNIFILSDLPIEEYVQFVSDELDFNDNIYAKLCLEHELYLVTDDTDFLTSGCNLISANGNIA